MSTNEPSRLPRLRILHLLLITGLLAVVFSILGSRPGEAIWGVFILFGLALIGIVATMFRPNPVKGALETLGDDVTQNIEALESALTRRNPFQVQTNTFARYRLMQFYKVQTRYEDAIAQGRQIIATRGLSPDLEKEVRAEIPICLDFLGREEAAAIEREAIDTDAGSEEPTSFIGWRAHGKALDKQNRFLEAADAYAKALDYVTPDSTEGRNELFLRLVLSMTNADKHDVALEWAKRALDAGVSGKGRYQIHRLAGQSCANLGRFDESLEHTKSAAKIAHDSGNLEMINESLAGLADLHNRRGELEQAAKLALQAEAGAPGGAQLPIAIHAMVFRNQGQFAEALERFKQAAKVGVKASAFHERKMQAALNRSIAMIQAELGQVDEAWENLTSASADAGDDPRLAPLCESAWVPLIALRGDRELAISRCDQAIEQLERESPGASVRLDCLEALGCGMLTIQDLSRAKICWERFLATTHPPIAEPAGYFFLGECHRQSGDLSAARECYERAIATGIDSHRTRQAAERLRDFHKGDQFA